MHVLVHSSIVRHHVVPPPPPRLEQSSVLLCLALECFLIARKWKAGLSQYSKPHPFRSYFPLVWNSDPGAALNDHPLYSVKGLPLY